MNGKLLHWVRFERDGRAGFGRMHGDIIEVFTGDMFADPQPTGERIPLAAVRLHAPCEPGTFYGLWNNFGERAAKEGLQRPAHPLYFVKTRNSYAGPGGRIPRPVGYAGAVVFEAELGIVIGRRCAGIGADEAADHIFGYTCVNDVTARDVMRIDPAFTHWTRGKSFAGFGVFGPCIAAGLAPDALRVRAVLDGAVLQDYPVTDMFFRPYEIVSRLSHDTVLEPGDLIACGTSVGAAPMPDGATIAVSIDGIGRLVNCFG